MVFILCVRLAWALVEETDALVALRARFCHCGVTADLVYKQPLRQGSCVGEPDKVGAV